MKKLFFITLFFVSLSFSQKINYFNYELFLRNYVTEAGVVDYDKIYKNKEALSKVLVDFEKTQPNIYWSNKESIAFWINSYNLYSIKIVIDNYPIKTIREIGDAWNKNFIPSRGALVSLNYIDNEILKSLNEPRYHFAINCTSFSCPNFKQEPYEAEKIGSQLEDCAVTFINDKTKNIITPRKIMLSKIFDWYKSEFTLDGTLIQYLNKYSEVKIKDDAAVIYQEYDWDLRKVN